MAVPPADDASLQEELRGTDRMLLAGIAWTAIFRWIAQAISWASTLYVARILVPADYGLVAMAAVPIGFARLVEDLGLDAIILQDRTLDREQLASLAGSVLCLGVVLTASFSLLATPIAAYFREPAVAAVVVALSLNFVLDAVQVVPRALLQRDLRFRTLAWLHGLQVTIAALVVGIGATLAWGYWALVLNGLASSMVVTIVLFGLRPFSVSWPRQLARISASLVSGWRMIVSRAAYFGYTSLDSAIIGRGLGKDALGAYGFSMTFASLPITEVSSVVGKVVPGVFSAVQESAAKLRRYFLVLTEALSYVTMPMSVGLLLTADDFVLLALGPRWEAVVLPLRILSLYMIVNASQMLFAHVLLWTGSFRAYMWLSVLSVAILPLCMYVGVHWGLAGVAWAWVLGFPLTVIPALFVVRRLLELRPIQYFGALLPAAIGCVVMSAAVLLVRHLLPPTWPHAGRLAVQVAAGALAYPLALLVAYRPRVWMIYELVRDSRRIPAGAAA
jgi:PST family polysaccharide transporter